MTTADDMKRAAAHAAVAMVEDGMLMLDTITVHDIGITKSGDTFYATAVEGTDDNAEILGSVPSSNGTIFVIDQVLTPQM